MSDVTSDKKPPLTVFQKNDDTEVQYEQVLLSMHNARDKDKCFMCTIVLNPRATLCGATDQYPHFTLATEGEGWFIMSHRPAKK